MWHVGYYMVNQRDDVEKSDSSGQESRHRHFICGVQDGRRGAPGAQRFTRQPERRKP